MTWRTANTINDCWWGYGGTGQWVDLRSRENYMEYDTAKVDKRSQTSERKVVRGGDPKDCGARSHEGCNEDRCTAWYFTSWKCTWWQHQWHTRNGRNDRELWADRCGETTQVSRAEIVLFLFFERSFYEDKEMRGIFQNSLMIWDLKPL